MRYVVCGMWYVVCGMWYVVSGAPFQAVHRGEERRGAGGVVVEPLLGLGLLGRLVGAVAVAGGRPRRADRSLQTRRQNN